MQAVRPVASVTPRRWQAECSNLCTAQRKYGKQNGYLLHIDQQQGGSWCRGGSGTTAGCQLRGSRLLTSDQLNLDNLLHLISSLKISLRNY